MSHHKHEHGEAQSQAAQHEALEVLAYQLWEQASRPEGQSARFWAQAQEQIEHSHRPALVSV